MPSQAIAGKVYKTTAEQRAKAAAWRAENREKSRAYAQTQAERLRSSFVGPRRPRGRQQIDGPTQHDIRDQERAARRQDRQRRQALQGLADALRCLGRRRPRGQADQVRAIVAAALPPACRSEAASKGHQTRQASFVGPPKPETIATAQRRALAAERQRLKMARVRAEFVGPPRPRGEVRRNPGLPKPPRPTRNPEVPKTTDATRATTKAHELVKAARERDAESCRVIRRTVVALQKLRTAERRRAWQQEYDRKRSMSDHERDALRAAREAARAKLNATMDAQNAQLLAHLEAERQEQEAKAAERARQRAEAEAQASALRMSAAPRRVAFTRPIPPSPN